MRILDKKRRRENKTNYTKRRKLLNSGKFRIVVRKTNKQIIMQYVESISAQDKILFSVSSFELLEHGWPTESKGSLKSLPAAYLTGFLLGKKLESLKSKLKNPIIDTGLIRSTKGSRIYAALKGLVDSGIQMTVGPEMIATEKRLFNENSSKFFDKVKSNIDKLKVGGKN